MYAWIWHHLPGPVFLRVLLSIVLVFGVIALLFIWVFPWVETQIEFDNSEVGQPGAASSVEPAAASVVEPAAASVIEQSDSAATVRTVRGVGL